MITGRWWRNRLAVISLGIGWGDKRWGPRDHLLRRIVAGLVVVGRRRLVGCLMRRRGRLSRLRAVPVPERPAVLPEFLPWTAWAESGKILLNGRSGLGGRRELLLGQLARLGPLTMAASRARSKVHLKPDWLPLGQFSAGGGWRWGSGGCHVLLQRGLP